MRAYSMHILWFDYMFTLHSKMLENQWVAWLKHFFHGTTLQQKMKHNTSNGWLGKVKSNFIYMLIKRPIRPLTSWESTWWQCWGETAFKKVKPGFAGWVEMLRWCFDAIWSWIEPSIYEYFLIALSGTSFCTHWQSCQSHVFIVGNLFSPLSGE